MTELKLLLHLPVIALCLLTLRMLYLEVYHA